MTDYVKRLLDVENESNAKVEKAEQERYKTYTKFDRSKCMMKAKEEAKVEIAKFRKEQEIAIQQQIDQVYFCSHQQEYGGKNETTEMEAETEIQIDTFKKMFELNKEKVIDLIIKNITSVDLELPMVCLLYTSPSPRDLSTSRMPSSA
eukprot:TRINITY_DN1672_c0_g1_i5.p2 TRINITY_DN1672_c0_g1~~TRINITY_DN1672_c0_g1_i5.p2  ORF type:complete len:148 (-),score=26.58 TRINITY_DN1672_c0_g1_i5:68-511(-)